MNGLAKVCENTFFNLVLFSLVSNVRSDHASIESPTEPQEPSLHVRGRNGWKDGTDAVLTLGSKRAVCS